MHSGKYVCKGMMRRYILMVGLVGCAMATVQGQLKRFYSLSDVESFDTVDFTLKATSGICFVRHVNGGNPLNIFGNPDLDVINPSFDAMVKGRTCSVNLTLDEFRTARLGDGLVYAMFSSEKEEETSNYWKILLNDKKVYLLDLNYGIGSSDIDLSDTYIRRFKVHSGSADVEVNYNKDLPNRCEMDTFMVKVDMGSVTARDLDQSRSSFVVAEVGFGQASLDFSDVMDRKCTVKASVGAGGLDVLLPKDGPVIIKIKDSPLCSIRMAKGFEEVEKNLYVNMSYHSHADNLLTFDVDVALGSITFKYAD